jgi:hypothetical protein
LTLKRASRLIVLDFSAQIQQSLPMRPPMTLSESAELMRKNYPKEILWSLEKKSEVSGTGNYPNGYWIIGFFDPRMLKVGEPIIFTRLADQSNPMGKHGWFRSSIVQSFEVLPDGSGWEVKTQNSVYEIRRLNSVMDVFYNEAEKSGFDIYQDEE